MDRRPVRITADTNVLVRAAVGDDPAQAKVAADLLLQADLVAVPLPVLCEFVRVLLRRYGRSADAIAASLDRLIQSANVSVDRPAAEAGLALLEAGGDFADGVIAFEGRRLGGAVFASFDRAAVELLAVTGTDTVLLATSDT
jgi:predicted nucleic-acid-binding protein